MDVLKGVQRPPVIADRLEERLKGYKDKGFVVDGFRYGFEVGYRGPGSSTTGRNSKSIRDHPLEAAAKVQLEVDLGRIAGPFVANPSL